MPDAIKIILMIAFFALLAFSLAADASDDSDLPR